MKYLYKKDLIGTDGNHKYADFVCENQGKILNEDDEKFWFEDAPIYEPTIQEQIVALEAQITLRRMREAMLGNKESIDFIEDIEKQIKSLREVI